MIQKFLSISSEANHRWSFAGEAIWGEIISPKRGVPKTETLIKFLFVWIFWWTKKQWPCNENLYW